MGQLSLTRRYLAAIRRKPGLRECPVRTGTRFTLRQLQWETPAGTIAKFLTHPNIAQFESYKAGRRVVTAASQEIVHLRPTNQA